MQRPIQRPTADATSVLLSNSFLKIASTTAAAEVPTLKANILSKSRPTRKKRRIHVKDGKGYVLTIDPLVILRTFIFLVAILCCFTACKSLSVNVKEMVATNSNQIRGQQDPIYKARSPEDSEKGKERIIQLLNEAGIFDLDIETLRRLPTWEEVM